MVFVASRVGFMLSCISKSIDSDSSRPDKSSSQATYSSWQFLLYKYFNILTCVSQETGEKVLLFLPIVAETSRDRFLSGLKIISMQ